MGFVLRLPCRGKLLLRALHALPAAAVLLIRRVVRLRAVVARVLPPRAQLLLDVADIAERDLQSTAQKLSKLESQSHTSDGSAAGRLSLYSQHGLRLEPSGNLALDHSVQPGKGGWSDGLTADLLDVVSLHGSIGAGS